MDERLRFFLLAIDGFVDVFCARRFGVCVKKERKRLVFGLFC